MSLYKLSHTFLSSSRIISHSQPTRFLKVAQFKLLQQQLQQQHATFHSSQQNYATFPYLFAKSGPYATEHSTPQPAHLEKVYIKTLKELPPEDTKMMIHSLHGAFLTTICKLMNAKKVLELGCFTGYSALCFAEGVKNNGIGAKVITCEYDSKFAEIALQNIKDAGMDDLVEVKIGKALDTIRNLDGSTKFDLIFIDADKGGYIDYYETVLERNLLSEKGIIMTDNTLSLGHVERVPNYDPEAPPSSENYIPKGGHLSFARNIHRFNEHVMKDPRTTKLLLPAFDGLTIIQKN